MNTGLRGGQRHQMLVEWTRQEVPARVQAAFPEPTWYFIYDDGYMAGLLGTSGNGDRREGYYPDGLWLYRTPEGRAGFIIIEVGNYCPDRTPDNMPVIHVGLQGCISVVNPPQDDKLIMQVAELLRTSLPFPAEPPQQRDPNERVRRLLHNLDISTAKGQRDAAILTLILGGARNCDIVASAQFTGINKGGRSTGKAVNSATIKRLLRDYTR